MDTQLPTAPSLTSDQTQAIERERDRVAAGMLGVSPLQFDRMTHLAKTQYRSLASNLLQLFQVSPKAGE